MRRTLLALALLCCNSHASNWHEFARDGNTIYELETTLVTKHDNGGKVLVVWARNQTAQRSIMTKYELHCASRSYRVILENITDSRGQLYSEDKSSHWRYAFPDSVEMALIDYSCYYYK